MLTVLPGDRSSDDEPLAHGGATALYVAGPRCAASRPSRVTIAGAVPGACGDRLVDAATLRRGAFGAGPVQAG